MSYVDGFVIPVYESKLDEYKKMAAAAGKLWMEHGALSYKECVLDDAEPAMPDDAPPECKIVGFRELASAKDNETVIFAFIVYKDRAHRDEVNAKVMEDPRMKEACPDINNMPFDLGRMNMGGFKVLVDL